MKTRYLSICSFLIIFSMILTNCNLPYQSEEENYDSTLTDNVIEQNSSLFTSETISNNAAYTNKITFTTNDNKYLTSYGYTLWTAGERTDFAEPIKMKLCKTSGNSSAGYGIVFCKQTYNNSDFLLTFMINTLGQYMIGKYVENRFSVITEWEDCNSLYKGVGVNNEIEILYERESFIVKINGVEADSFSVEENIAINDTNYGYVVVISNTENFPSIPVTVSFLTNN